MISMVCSQFLLCVHHHRKRSERSHKRHSLSQLLRRHRRKRRLHFFAVSPLSLRTTYLTYFVFEQNGEDPSIESLVALMLAPIARKIMTPPLITLGIAGGTGAGKTTLAQAVFRELGGEANVVYLSHDHYYKDISHKTLEERSKTNFDHPDSLDTALLVQHIRELKDGKTANLPTYDFATHSRTPVTTLVHPKRILLVEGILIFTSPDLCKECDIKVFVDADADTRVVRRIARDTKERGRTLESIMSQYEKTVKPMHNEWVEPSKTKADVIVNSETGHSVGVAISILSSHLRLHGGLLGGDHDETTTVETK